MKVVRKSGPADPILKEALKKLDGMVGKVGWFPSAKYPDGTSVAYVATVQEYGDPSHNIPPRPTGRQTKSKYGADWKRVAQEGAKAVMQGTTTVNVMFEKLVSLAAGQWRATITRLQQPPLKESTIDTRTRKTAAYQNLKTRKAKKKMREENRSNPTFVKPLVETAIMLNTLTYTVENKK